MILAILLKHIVVIVVLFFCFLALLVGFRLKKAGERDQKDAERYTGRAEKPIIEEHEEAMFN